MASVSEMREVIRLQVRIGSQIADRRHRNSLFKRIARVSKNIECPHDESEILAFGVALYEMETEVEGCIVEAGCFKGGSTAKFSLFVSDVGRELVVFDSFEGMPENEEGHDVSILGHSIEGWFEPGNFLGELDEVKANITQYGEIDVCTFIPGWFDDTMPRFDQPIAAAYLDCDLAESTKTCLKNLYPLVSPGGWVFSQDGDFPLVIEVLRDEAFWRSEVGTAPPQINGLGEQKLLAIQKT